MRKITVLPLAIILFFASCYPTPGPDKSITGAILGAGWGAGAGAVIGNQVNSTGAGAAIGSGFGLASGLMTGVALDVAEGYEIEQQRELDALKVQVAANHRKIMMLQSGFDNRNTGMKRSANGGKIFFSKNRASLQLGSAQELERIADSLKLNPYISLVEIHGHSDNTGTPKQNRDLSAARARTVATFLVNHGISLDQIKLYAHGSGKPLSSNATDAGRQLNRRVEVVVR